MRYLAVPIFTLCLFFLGACGDASPEQTPTKTEPREELSSTGSRAGTAKLVKNQLGREAVTRVANGHPDHTIWDALVKKYVSPTGKVNYNGFKSDKDKLQAYLSELAEHPVQAGWSRAEKMAYWINVYNAFTIKLITDNYPLKSITELHGGKPWDVQWIELGDKTYSLNQVENEILRPQFKDPRIHFAVNCAAKSCPPLLNRAWTGERLESDLEQQAKAFINHSKYNTLTNKKASVSKIFEWYSEDFGNLVDYLNRYAGTKLAKNAAVSFREYDWALNDQ